MGLKVQDVSELDPALVESAQAELTQFLQEAYPEVELGRGVIHDIVAFFSGGISGGINQTEVNRVLESRSLLAINENPLLADDELVDHVLSNYLIERKTGARARGEITIVVTGDGTVVVSANTLYTANGLDFYVDESITARPPGTTTTEPNDRVLEPRGDGTYEFTIPATAAAVGEESNVRTNTKFTPDPTPPRFVTAYAAKDFTGGVSLESNAQLVARMQLGIPAKVTAGRVNVEALVKAQAVFADIKNLSIIGYGDPEMTRDQHWIFPVSGGGRVDVYAQNAALPRTITIRKAARVIEIGTTTSTWQFSLGRDDMPGFYEVDTVRRPTDPIDTNGFEVISDIRGVDFDDDSWQPDLQSSAEAVYTRYQTAIIQFVDTATAVSGLTVGDEVEYDVSITGQPFLREMQEFLAGADHRYLASDILVRGAVPCYMSINCDIVKDTNESSPDLDAIKVAMADYVNNLDFPGTLYGSQITDIIHDFLSGTQAVDSLIMHGRIRRIDGSISVVRDHRVFRIPDSPSTLVTPRTTTLILYPEDIGLTVVNRS